VVERSAMSAVRRRVRDSLQEKRGKDHAGEEG
jgi:hypothetical protein